MINRRGLITGLISLAAAPAIVRASSLMPVKVIRQITPQDILNLWMSDYAAQMQKASEEMILYGSSVMRIEHDPNTIDGIVLTKLDPYIKLD